MFVKITLNLTSNCAFSNHCLTEVAFQLAPFPRHLHSLLKGEYPGRYCFSSCSFILSLLISLKTTPFFDSRPETLSNLVKVTQLISTEAGAGTLAFSTFSSQRGE